MGCTRFDLTVSVNFRYWSHSQFLHNPGKRDLSGYKLHQPFLLHSRCSHLLKRQQFISVIFILFLACFNFRGQSAGQIIADCIKTVKNRNNALLFLKRRYCNHSLCNIVVVQSWNCSTLRCFPRFQFIAITKIAIQNNTFIVIDPNNVGILKICWFAVINDSSANRSCRRNQHIAFFREVISRPIFVKCFLRNIGICFFSKSSNFIERNTAHRICLALQNTLTHTDRANIT